MKFNSLTEKEFGLLYKTYPTEILRFRLGKVNTDTQRLMPLSFKWIATRVKKYGLEAKPKGRPVKELFCKDEQPDVAVTEGIIARILKEEYGIKMAKEVFERNGAEFPKGV